MCRLGALKIISVLELFVKEFFMDRRLRLYQVDLQPRHLVPVGELRKNLNHFVRRKSALVNRDFAPTNSAARSERPSQAEK